MSGYTKPFPMQLNPDVGGASMRFKRLTLVGSLHVEFDSHYGGIAIDLRLLFTFFDFGNAGRIGL
jgi:hypothetical protein